MIVVHAESAANHIAIVLIECVRETYAGREILLVRRQRKLRIRIAGPSAIEGDAARAIQRIEMRLGVAAGRSALVGERIVGSDASLMNEAVGILREIPQSVVRVPRLTEEVVAQPGSEGEAWLRLELVLDEACGNVA